MSIPSLFTGFNVINIKLAITASQFSLVKFAMTRRIFFFQITYGSRFCCVNLGYDKSPKEKIIRSEITWPYWPVHITPTCNEAIRKHLMQQSNVGLCCTVARGTILLKLQFCKVNIFKIRRQIIFHTLTGCYTEPVFLFFIFIWRIKCF
jgi:hypothetical protein